MENFLISQVTALREFLGHGMGEETEADTGGFHVIRRYSWVFRETRSSRDDRI